MSFSKRVEALMPTALPRQKTTNRVGEMNRAIESLDSKLIEVAVTTCEEPKQSDLASWTATMKLTTARTSAAINLSRARAKRRAK